MHTKDEHVNRIRGMWERCCCDMNTFKAVNYGQFLCECGLLSLSALREVSDVLDDAFAESIKIVILHRES
jgi:hypothetical protein